MVDVYDGFLFLHGGTSNEYEQYMFTHRNKKTNLITLISYIWLCKNLNEYIQAMSQSGRTILKWHQKKEIWETSKERKNATY